MRVRFRVAALCASLLIGAHASAQTGSAPVPPSLSSRLEPLLADARWGAFRIGIVVSDASTGRALFEHGADVSLNPASNAKVLTAAVALSVLGPSKRFVTSLHGDVRAGAVAGPLVLRGDGDPSLRSADLFELAQRLAALGVRRVDGDLIVDDAALGSEHLPPAFDQRPRETAAFRASVSAVSVEENAVAIEVRPAATEGAPAVVGAFPAGCVEVETTLVTGGTAPAVTITSSLDASGRERVRVAGTVPRAATSATYRRRIENPSLSSGYVLRAMLAAAGIRVRGSVRVAPGSVGRLASIASHESAPLSALLYEVGKESNNFYAEMALLAIAAAAQSAPPTAPDFARGAERMTRWAREAGVESSGLVVRNGSGLYDANRMTARQISQVLRAAWRDPAIRDEYIAQFAVAGDDGTLRNRLRLRERPRIVRAKTGTLDDAIALSGFVLSADPSRTLVFAFVANGVHGHTAEARQLADHIVERIVGAAADEANAVSSEN